MVEQNDIRKILEQARHDLVAGERMIPPHDQASRKAEEIMPVMVESTDKIEEDTGSLEKEAALKVVEFKISDFLSSTNLNGVIFNHFMDIRNELLDLRHAIRSDREAVRGDDEEVSFSP